MTKKCAHCGGWTCECGVPAVALLATRERGGVLGRDNRMTGPPDAFCQRCLEGVARVRGPTVAALADYITWLPQKVGTAP